MSYDYLLHRLKVPVVESIGNRLNALIEEAYSLGAARDFEYCEEDVQANDRRLEETNYAPDLRIYDTFHGRHYSPTRLDYARAKSFFKEFRSNDRTQWKKQYFHSVRSELAYRLIRQHLDAITSLRVYSMNNPYED